MRSLRQAVSGNGQTRVEGEVPFALEPPPGMRRVRPPELALGVVLVVGFALAAVLWTAQANEKQPVLMLAKTVERGQVLNAEDLGVAYVASAQQLAVLPQSDAAGLVGQVALIDLPAGTVITKGQFAPGVSTKVAPGGGVLGLALDAGEYPTGRLGPGDQVNVVVASEEAQAPEMIATRAGGEVFDVEEMGSGQLLVSLQMAEADADRVASAVASGQAVRLVVVAAQ